MPRPLRCEIRTEALRDNFRAARRLSSARRMLAVVKDDAYGHGLVRTARALAGLADGFATVAPEDARTLRRAGIAGPILLLNGMFGPEDAAAVGESGAWVVAHERRQLEWLAGLAAEVAPVVFVKVDTGMGRLGFAPGDFAAVRAAAAAGGRRVALMTHFACADAPGGLRAPLRTVADLRAGAAAGLEVSLGNSAATMLHEDLADDWARVGIALYGASPAPAWRGRDALGLRAAMVLRTELLSARTLAKGAAAGYGGAFVAPAAMPLGVAAVGYGDGYPRLMNGGWARVFPTGAGKGRRGGAEGFRAEVVGRVSMDLTALDLRRGPAGGVGAGVGVGAGDEVVLWGDSPSVDEVAGAGGMIAYELLARLSGRTPRTTAAE